MTCPTCRGHGIVMLERPTYRACRACGGNGCRDCERTGNVLELGHTADACPRCTAEWEARWNVASMGAPERMAS